MQGRLIQLLLKHGADPEVENERGDRALKLCIENENLVGMQLLMREVPFELQPPTRNNSYIYFLTNIACQGWNQMQYVH